LKYYQDMDKSSRYINLLRNNYQVWWFACDCRFNCWNKVISFKELTN
jgi:hypothetical protein